MRRLRYSYASLARSMQPRRLPEPAGHDMSRRALGLGFILRRTRQACEADGVFSRSTHEQIPLRVAPHSCRLCIHGPVRRQRPRRFRRDRSTEMQLRQSRSGRYWHLPDRDRDDPDGGGTAAARRGAAGGARGDRIRARALLLRQRRHDEHLYAQLRELQCRVAPAVTGRGPLQIRTRRFTPSGSSVGSTYGRPQICTLTLGCGSGFILSSCRNRSQVIRAR